MTVDGDTRRVGDQIGAMVGSVGDVGVAMKVGMNGRARVAGYKSLPAWRRGASRQRDEGMGNKFDVA